jgi:hypothetical protein
MVKNPEEDSPQSHREHREEKKRSVDRITGLT